MLFIVVAAISMLMVSTFYDKSRQVASEFFDKSARGLLGEAVLTDCGNGSCEPAKGESFINCPQDCHCGNVLCELDKGETAANCGQDCTCGNDICESYKDETLITCPADCTCGNGSCQPAKGETIANCCEDCHVCGDASCSDCEYGGTHFCSTDCCPVDQCNNSSDCTGSYACQQCTFPGPPDPNPNCYDGHCACRPHGSNMGFSNSCCGTGCCSGGCVWVNPPGLPGGYVCT